MPRRIDNLLLFYKDTSPNLNADQFDKPNEAVKSFQLLMTETTGRASNLATERQNPTRFTSTKTAVPAHATCKTIAEELESHHIVRHAQQNTAWIEQRARPVETKGATRPVNLPDLTGYSLTKSPPSHLEVAPSYYYYDYNRKGQGERAPRIHRRHPRKQVQSHSEAALPPVSDWTDTSDDETPQNLVPMMTSSATVKNDPKFQAITKELSLIHTSIDRIRKMIE